jgi:hypothetical protein
VLIKNVLPHSDDLHDGRPIDSCETAEITADDFQLEHYQARLRDGLIVVVSENASAPQTVPDIVAAIDAAPESEREALKAQFRAAEEASEHPRVGVLDATKPDSEEND